ncbi:hypothetical protein DERP_002412, partial [Dermatophagoides pteronyssinus]
GNPGSDGGNCVAVDKIVSLSDFFTRLTNEPVSGDCAGNDDGGNPGSDGDSCVAVDKIVSLSDFFTRLTNEPVSGDCAGNDVGEFLSGAKLISFT